MDVPGRPREDLILQTHDGSQCVTWSSSQLTYMGRDSTEIPLVLSKVYGRHAKRVDFSFCCLVTLKGLESFTVVTELILDNNCLDDDVLFPEIKNLTALSLNKNKFSKLDLLLSKLSRACPKLIFLSLLGNDCCPDSLTRETDGHDVDYTCYRTKVISKFPRIQFLDSNRVKSSERRQALLGPTRVLPFIVRPSEEQLRLQDEDHDVTPQVVETGVPAIPSTSCTTTAYGKVRYRYTGKHSEGNRFIRNNQL